MNPLIKLRNMVEGPLSALRDAPPPARPAVAPVPVAAVRRDNGAAGGVWNPVLLEAKDMKEGRFRASEWSNIGYFVIPEGVRLMLRAGENYRMYLQGRATRAGNNPGAATARQVVGLTGMVRTSRGAPNLPSLYHPDVVVWAKVGGTWQQAPVTAVDFAVGNVSFTEPAGCTEIEVYYTHSIGEWRFRIYDAKGSSDTAATTINNGSFGAIALIDQNNSETAHTWPTQVDLVPSQRLALEVNTSVETLFTPRARHTLILTAYQQQIRVINRDVLRAAATADLNRGR